MKITSSRKDDIIRRRDEFDKRANEVKKLQQEEYERYHQAERAVTEGAKKELESMLSKYGFADLEVRVEPGLFRAPGISVTIRVNDRSVHSDKKALSWNYDARLGKDGEVIRETSSWSGLNAVTEEQLSDLENTLACLKMLAGLDWEKFLNRSMPEWKDYIKTETPEDLKRRPNFEQELADAELEDLVGSRKMILCKNFPSSWYGRNVYVAIIKDSGSQWTIKEIPEYYVEQNPEEATKAFDKSESHRVKKSQIVPVKPYKIIEV